MLETFKAGNGSGGKNAMTNTTARKASDTMLISSPSLPMLNFEGSMGWPERRRQTKHPMQTVYDTMRVPLVKETRLLKAALGHVSQGYGIISQMNSLTSGSNVDQ